MSFFVPHYSQIFSLNPGCHSTLAVLPSEKASQGKKTQKFCVIDGTNSLRAYSLKKDNFVSSFDVTLPTVPSNLSVGGKSRSGTYNIYLSIGNTVLGFNKKGSQVSKFETSSTDSLTNIFAENDLVHVLTHSTYSVYKDDEEEYFFLSSEIISSFLPLPLLSSVLPSPSPVLLGSTDCSLRLVQGNTLLCQITLPSPITSLCCLTFDPTDFLESTATPFGDVRVAYGLQNGITGVVSVTGRTINHLWSSEGISELSATSSIVALDICSMNFLEDTTIDVLIVGREDGLVQFIGDTSENTSGSMFSFCGELKFDDKISSICHGRFLSTSGIFAPFVSCISGRVFHLFAANSPSEFKITSSHVKKLETEVIDLESKLKKMVSKYDSLSQSAVTSSNISVKILPLTEIAAFKLVVESEMPIIRVLLTSSVPISLMSSTSGINFSTSCDKTIESNETTLTLIKTTDSFAAFNHTEGNNKVAAVLVPTASSALRVETYFRTIEGTTGVIDLVTMFRGYGDDISTKKSSIPLKPLALHHIIAQVPPMVDTSEVSITGTFSVSEAYRWLVQLVPGMSERLVSDSGTLSCVSLFSGAYLSISYRSGAIVAKSDNITALSIIKEMVSRLATRAKINVNIGINVKPSSVARFLEKLNSKHVEVLDLSKRYSLLSALREISLNEPDFRTWLSPEFVELLDQGNELEAKFRDQPRILEIFKGCLTDLYIDYWRMFGTTDCSAKLNEYLNAVNNYSIDSIMSFFR
ncbi:hypothetical protein RCL1_005644 [Eukaryota sp. TZLM3-RCL]